MLNFISHLFRLSGRKGIIIVIVLIIVTFTLYDTDNSSYGSITSPSSIPHNPAPPETEAVVRLPNHALQPESCDPKTYPITSLQRQLLTPPTDPDPIWGLENHHQFKALCNCVLTNTCAPNQDQVVILNAHYFQPWYNREVKASNGGETIWATSMIESLRLLKYTFLYVDDFGELQDFYSLLSKSVVGIIMHEDNINDCWADPEYCVKSPHNPHGPPIWKMFTFHFWTHPAHPLGRLWTLSPENYAEHSGQDPKTHGNTYIGYSIEPSCDEQPIIPASKRIPKAVYAMTKCVAYLAPQPLRAWPPSFYAHAAQSLGVHFTIGSINSTAPLAVQQCGGVEDKLVYPQLSEFGGEEAMTNLGTLPRPVFMKKVAESQVLLGVGRPWISPTPYQGLCLGVPFINPVLEWDHSKPNDRRSWNTQHNGLRDIEPPYVYNVHKDDEEGFLRALSQAMEHPIGRYIPPGKSLVEVADRLQEVLRRDWKREAEDLLGERIRTKQGEKFTL